MQNSKHVRTLHVIDPDTQLPVEVEIRKLDSGAMVGLDGSFLAQMSDEEQPFDPYDGKPFIVPDDEK